MRDVAISYPTENGMFTAVEDVSFSVARGEKFILLGPSGCGKSTLLKSVAGFMPPTRGTVELEGRTVSRPGPDRVVVFQEFDQLLPWKTVRQNVSFALTASGMLRGRAAEEQAMHYIAKVGLGEFANAYPHTLSGGMKQRVAIARGLVQNPAVLLMDEPFASLDEQTRMVLGDELLRIWSETRKTVLFVTHSLNEAVYLADRVVVLSARPGRVVDDVSVDLPRPRSFAMTGSERFGALKNRIWQHIKSAERR